MAQGHISYIYILVIYFSPKTLCKFTPQNEYITLKVKIILLALEYLYIVKVYFFNKLRLPLKTRTFFGCEHLDRLFGFHNRHFSYSLFPFSIRNK